MAIRYTNYKGETETTFVGQVLRTWTSEDRIMSDVWALVRKIECYDPDADDLVVKRFDLDGISDCRRAGKPIRLEYEIDATDEVKAKAEAIRAKRAAEKAAREAKWEAERQARLKAEAKAKAELEAKTARGAIVQTTRKIKTFPKGTCGTVFWRGDCKFSGKPRVGIRTKTGDTVFVNAVSVKLIASAN